MEAYVRNYIRACEAFGWDGGPEFKTDVKTMANKAEKRNAMWSQSRFFTTLPFQNITQEACGAIWDMFEDRAGKWGAFLYFNPIRNRVDDHVFGVGDGAQTKFQLVYVSGVGSRERRRNVYALYVPANPYNPETRMLGSDEAVEAQVTIWSNGTPTTAVEIDYDRGTVVFDTAPAPGAVLSWSGQFSHWVRFNQDELPFSIDNKSGGKYVVNGDVDVREVNPPLASELGSSS